MEPDSRIETSSAEILTFSTIRCSVIEPDSGLKLQSRVLARVGFDGYEVIGHEFGIETERGDG